MDEQQYQETSRDPVAFRKDGDVSRYFPLFFYVSQSLVYSLWG
jgi:hypothetical protein